MVLSSKRKLNETEKTDLITPEVKRGKVSDDCDLLSLHVDENIPYNMQEGSTDNTSKATPLESEVIQQSPDDANEFNEQKPLRKIKNRLNLLKRGKTVINQQKNEGETISCVRNECSSAIIHEQCSKKVADKEDIKDCECDLNCLGQEEDRDMPCCPVCKNDISMLGSDTELNMHINDCLDNERNGSAKASSSIISTKEFSFCEICKRDISSYNTVQLQQHYNRCCDSMHETQNEAAAIQKQFPCLICGKICKTLKTRQSHMKSCAKKNNVSTAQLVELNRNENIENQNIENKEFVTGPGNVRAYGAKTKESTNKRKKNARLQGKNLDDDTQLALVLSASLQSNEKDKELGKRSKKKHKTQTEVPALLLRNENEMKKVTEARAAAVLCHWADSDDEIQCTPALAPSSLLKKYSSSSEFDTQFTCSDQLKIISENTDPEEKEFAEKSENEDMEVSMSEGDSNNVIKRNAVVEKANESKKPDQILSAETICKEEDSDEKHLTIDKDTRLWRVSSLCADNLSDANFYVPNLLPKTTPRKKKSRSSSQVTEKQKECHVVPDEDNDEKQAKTTNENDRITESQKVDIQLLAELVCEEILEEVQSNVDERENDEELDQTWYHSSGFCITKDIHKQEEESNKNVESLVNDLSSMVGNCSLSDVKILAKNKQKFYAHSFMLATRCATLAKLIKENSCSSEDERYNFITLEMMDIDVRAVHAVMTYIYTASYIPVSYDVSEDVKKLVERLNLNCDVDSWEALNDSVHRDKDVLLKDSEDNLEQDGTEGDERRTDLDVLLKSLWEGEDIRENSGEEENAFGDSVLDEVLSDMEIKIYTQVTPKKNNGSSEETSGVELKGCKKMKQKSFIEESPLSSDEDIVGASEWRDEDFHVEKSIVKVSEDNSNCDDTEKTFMQSEEYALSPSVSSLNNVLEFMDSEDGNISSGSDSWFVPQTPRKSRECEIQALKEDGLLEEVAEPGRTTILARNPDKLPSCDDTSDSHVRTCKRRYPLTTHRHSSPTKIHCLSIHGSPNSIIDCHSPLSPVEVILSPSSTKPFSPEQDDGNSAMDTNYNDDVRKSEEPECYALVNSNLQGVSETSLNITGNTKKFYEKDVSVSSSSPRNEFSPEFVPDNENESNENESNENESNENESNENESNENEFHENEFHENELHENNFNVNDCDENDDCIGNPYNDQEFYCDDDGGFNCDLVECLDTVANLQCKVTEVHQETEAVKNVQSKAESCKKQVKDGRKKQNVSKRSQAVSNKRQKLESQTPITPILDYSNMATPDLTVELKHYGVRQLGKRKMVFKLKEIYQYTHRDTSSESEPEDHDHQKTTTAEIKQPNKKEPQLSNNSDGNIQSSGGSSESSGSFSDDELSKDDEILSQESSLNLSKKLMKCLSQNNELYLRILRYEPVPLTSIEELLKVNKIKCSSAKLKDFLDEQCITFKEPRTARAKKRNGRAKSKSQKNNRQQPQLIIE